MVEQTLLKALLQGKSTKKTPMPIGYNKNCYLCMLYSVRSPLGLHQRKILIV